MPLAIDWSFYSEYWHPLLWGFIRTLEVSVIAIVLAFVIGALGGAARAYRIPVLSQVAAVYVEVFRCTPILLQIFFFYFGLPEIGIVWKPFTIAWLAVGLWGGAYNIENFRAGFQAVPNGLREAAFALGFGRRAVFLNVSLPIGARISLPSSINTYIAAVKNTALVYAIGYNELTTTAMNINAVTLRNEPFVVLGVVYLTLVWSLSYVLRLVERHLAVPERA